MGLWQPQPSLVFPVVQLHYDIERPILPIAKQ